MKYTINEISGGQIKVTFEDNSWAYVRVGSDDSAEKIDEIVGGYTNEYVKAESANSNVSVGEQRSTVDPAVAEKARADADKANLTDFYKLDTGKLSSYIEPATAYYLAQKLAAAGDSSLLDMFNTRLQTIQDDKDFNLDNLKQAFNNSVSS